MPNMVLLALAVIIPLAIVLNSGKKNEQKWQNERNARPADQRPDHEIVDNHTSGGAWAFAVFILVVLVLAALHGAI